MWYSEGRLNLDSTANMVNAYGLLILRFTWSYKSEEFVPIARTMKITFYILK